MRPLPTNSISDAGQYWKLVRTALLQNPDRPVYATLQDTWTSGALARLSRRLARDLLRLGVTRGTRLALALEASAEMLALLWAGLDLDCQLVLIAPRLLAKSPTAEPHQLQNRWQIILQQTASTVLIYQPKTGLPTAGTPLCDDQFDPPSNAARTLCSLRVLQREGGQPRQPVRAAECRWILATSGSTASPRWIALPDTTIWHNLWWHLAALDCQTSRQNDSMQGSLDLTQWPALSADSLHQFLQGAFAAAQPAGRALNLLPWHHPFGLVLDLFLNLLRGWLIQRDPDGGRHPGRILGTPHLRACDWLSAVPRTMSELCALPDGRQWLHHLKGGIVGGAPIDPALAMQLQGSQLRIGYGQGEAGPGICLGATGQFRAGLIGQAVACSIRLQPDGELAWQGANQAAGILIDGDLHPLTDKADGWIPSGDLADLDAGQYYFKGRKADSIKLPNGRFFHPLQCEHRLTALYPQFTAALCLQNPVTWQLELALVCHIGISSHHHGANQGRTNPAKDELLVPDPMRAAVQARSKLECGFAFAAIHTVPDTLLHWNGKGDLHRRASRQAIQNYLFNGA
ncbi:MAG: acyl--CoA ligase [Leptospiraceae bacterium]|nr:acyl--CoA ligase [Leptospiraceae bacterium]